MTLKVRRERFIPYRKADVIEMCIDDAKLASAEISDFPDFCKILQVIFHYEFHQRLEILKNCYAPFNPDTDTRALHSYSEQEKNDLHAELVRELKDILSAANFERITAEDLEQALAEESLFKIRLEVDFNDFKDVIFFRRGESIRQETLVRFYGLSKKSFTFTNYDRVAVFITFKEKAYFEQQKRKNLYFEPGSTIIKLFHNVPKADLEMLFPNSKVRMKPIDKLIIGVPALVSGIVVVVTKLGASLMLIASVIAFWLGFAKEEVQIKQNHLIALGAGLATLGGLIFRQINKFKNRKISFMKALADNLYFKNLDNNAGVFHHLIDAAEEEEFKEAVLAYYFLLTSDQSLTQQQLDEKIENWFATRWKCQLDFEIDDALLKLIRLKLVVRDGEMLRCLPLAEAKQQLDTIWDDYFNYS